MKQNKTQVKHITLSTDWRGY